MVIQWRVPSYMEVQLSFPENNHLFDIFFSRQPNAYDLLVEIYNHNQNIVGAIQTEIIFGDKRIKIDRNSIINELKIAFQEEKNLIISGEGGCGKTAILKEFYTLHSKEFPICVFKANELNVKHINDIFIFGHKFTFDQFLDAYRDESNKVFVIDSAEKLAENTNNDILSFLIQKLKENQWNIVFTTRYAYLNDLTFHIKENYQLSFKGVDISLLNFDELKSISKEFNFSLPQNQKLLERLRNLFFLKEYVHQYDSIDKRGSFKKFTDLLWKKRIQNNIIQKDNLHILRENCLINIAKKRCTTGRFYINGDNLSQLALSELKQDEILGYDESNGGYFITHDIYEEWTLDKIVSRCFANSSNTKEFFKKLGNSLTMRRAFRLWLSDHLFEKGKEIEEFIQDAFKNEETSQFWKDEILVSVLLSDYSETFFKFFESEIIDNDFKILKRILFLLRIACTDVSAFGKIDIIKPKGKGWEVTIKFIYTNMDTFFDKNLKLTLPILKDWCEFTKKGETSRYCGLLSLGIIQKAETEEKFYIHSGDEENILKVVFNATNELQPELKEIFDKVISNKWINHRNPYNRLCSKILEKPYIAIELIKTFPLSIVKICDLFWQKKLKESDHFGYSEYGIENRYGLTRKHSFRYFPPSPNQTPIKWLLHVAFQDTLEFIIDFTNRAIESYSKSDYRKKDVEKIVLHVKEKEVEQYLSCAIWSMYRGNRSPDVPNLLQSIHMALEKTLLKFSLKYRSGIIQEILLKILILSKSGSLTSVVCSIVLAYPDKFYDIALILFKTIELFHIDTYRSANEFRVKSLYSIGQGADGAERLKTCEDDHRNSNLESLFLEYQFFGVKGFTEEQNSEFIEKLYNIIDQHKSNDSTKNRFGILLARMDRRNLLLSKVSKHDDNNLLIEVSPKELSDDLRKKSEQAKNQYQEFLKYTNLKMWSDFLMDPSIDKKYDEFDNEPLLALKETKQLIEELESGRNATRRFDSSIPSFSCSKLMIEHKELLSKDDKDFCKKIILSSISRLFDDSYDYQISDGVEASLHAVPSLMQEYQDETEEYIAIMIFALLDKTSVGHKRICDYVTESIHDSNLWQQNESVAQSILLSYIKFKPLYKNILAKKGRGKRNWERIPKSSILEELEKIDIGSNLLDIPFDIMDVEILDIDDLEVIYQLIPSITKNDIHLDIYTQSIPLLASQLLKDRRYYKEESGDDTSIYSLRRRIFKRFANFILQREKGEIDKYLEPFINFLRLQKKLLGSLKK